MEYILKQLGSSLLPVLMQLAYENMDEVRGFLKAEALKTDNKLDDHVVEFVCDWLESFLKDQIDG